MTALPADLQVLLNEVDAADRAAETLVSGLTDDQLHWQPDGGRAWSIAQCLEHLGATNLLYTEAIRAAVDSARGKRWVRQGASQPGFFGARFIRSLEPPVKRRLRAPSTVRPSSGLPRAQVLRRYRDAHARLRDLIHEAASIDVNRATFKNPFLPVIRVKVATGLRVIPAHDRRHLWQAEQVRLRPDFPKGSPASA